MWSVWEIRSFRVLNLLDLPDKGRAGPLLKLHLDEQHDTHLCYTVGEPQKQISVKVVILHPSRVGAQLPRVACLSRRTA